MDLSLITPLIFAAVGLIASSYIFWGRRKSKKLLCPFGMKCDLVVQSEYSKIFGIFSNEIIGMGYYLVILLTYLFILTGPSVIPEVIIFELTLLSSFAVLFSLYLLLIQTLALREYCFWCITSLLSSIGIFVAVATSASFDFVSVFNHSKEILLIMHLFAMVLGLGGATFNDIFFFRFLKDLKISREELSILRTFSNIIWIGVILAIISGVGLFLPESERLLASSKFIAKVLIFIVLVFNGALFHTYVIPHMTKFNFKKEPKPRIRKYRRTAFVMGAVSIVSWYSVFILGTLRSLPWSAMEIMLLYALLLFIATSISLTYESYLHLKRET